VRAARRAIAIGGRVAVAALLLASGAQAQVAGVNCPGRPTTDAQLGPEGDMRFTVRPVGQGKVLIAEGGIEESTPALLRAALAAHAPVSEVWLRSAGGNAVAGNRAAEILRKSGVPVRIPSNWWCISACNFVFFGGVIRYIDPGGQFGVHMATVVGNAEYQKYILDLAKKGAAGNLLSQIALREQRMAKLTADDIDVVLRMGISRKLLSEVMYEQRADSFRDEDGDGKYDFGKVPTYRCLTRAEMVRYNVVNVD
jgi:hypothetical protein